MPKWIEDVSQGWISKRKATKKQYLLPKEKSLDRFSSPKWSALNTYEQYWMDLTGYIYTHAYVYVSSIAVNISDQGVL